MKKRTRARELALQLLYQIGLIELHPPEDRVPGGQAHDTGSSLAENVPLPVDGADVDVDADIVHDVVDQRLSRHALVGGVCRGREIPIVVASLCPTSRAYRDRFGNVMHRCAKGRTKAIEKLLNSADTSTDSVVETSSHEAQQAQKRTQHPTE